MSVAAAHSVEGHVSREFEAVREAFADNFARRRELGGACCFYRRGEKVVDLWGGVRNKQTGEPWQQMNRMGTRLSGDPRDVALRDALYSAIPAPSGALGRLVA
jgi:hypothetical protein